MNAMITALAKNTAENLKKAMGDGWNEELQKRTGFTKNTVTKAIDALDYLHPVVKAAISLAEEKDKERAAEAERLALVLDKVA